MQKYKKLLVILAFPLLFLNGCCAFCPECQTTSPQTAAKVCYQVTGTTVTAVDTGMKIYGELYRAGKISADLEAKVHSAYNVYQSAITIAILACDAISKATSPTQVAVAQDAKAKADAQLMQARDSLIGLLTAAGVSGI